MGMENIMASLHLSTLGARMLSLLAATGVVVVTLLSWGSPQSASAAAGTCSRYWTGAVSSAWEVNGNWSATDGGGASTVPTVSDVACMSTAPTRTLVVVNDSRQVAGRHLPGHRDGRPDAAGHRIGRTPGRRRDAGLLRLDRQDASAPARQPSERDGTGYRRHRRLPRRRDPRQRRRQPDHRVLRRRVPGQRHLGDPRRWVQARQQGHLHEHQRFGLLRSQHRTNGNKVVNEGTWTITNTSNDPLYDLYGFGSFTNAVGGTVTVTTPTTAGVVPRNYVPIVNNGTLNITRGHVANAVDASGSGTYNLASGTSYDHINGTLDLTGATWTGTGTFNLSGGNLTGTGTLPATTKLHNGTLLGGGDGAYRSSPVMLIESPHLGRVSL